MEAYDRLWYMTTLFRRMISMSKRDSLFGAVGPKEWRETIVPIEAAPAFMHTSVESEEDELPIKFKAEEAEKQRGHFCNRTATSTSQSDSGERSRVI